MSFWSSSGKRKSGAVEESKNAEQQSRERSESQVREKGSLPDEKPAAPLDSYLLNGGKVRTAIPREVSFTGKLYYDAPVRIEGKVQGEFSSTNELVVSADARMDAKVSVGTLVVEGCVNGQVRAFEKVEIKAGGSMEGVLEAPVLLLHEGGFCNADVKTGVLPAFAALPDEQGQLALGLAVNE